MKSAGKMLQARISKQSEQQQNACYAIKVATAGKYNTLSQLQNVKRVNAKWFNLQLKLDLGLFCVYKLHVKS